MSLTSRFSGMVKLRAEERRSFRLLFLLSLITGVALSFYFVAVNTFLIQNTSVSNLPYAYIISGIGGVLLIRIYQARQRKAGIIRSYLEFLFAFSVVSIIVFIAYVRLGTDPSYAVYLAYFGFLFNMPFTIVFALSFSAIFLPRCLVNCSAVPIICFLQQPCAFCRHSFRSTSCSVKTGLS